MRVDEFGSLELRAGRVQLVPVTPDAYQYLYWLASSSNGFRWRYRSGTPPYEAFVQQLHADVLCHYVVTTTSPFERIGYVVVYSPDLRSLHANYGLILDPKHTAQGLGADATSAFLSYVFAMWPLRKLYMELPEYNAELTARAEPWVVREAVLPDYHFFNGQYWDQYILSLSREAWVAGDGRERALKADQRAHLSVQSLDEMKST